MIVLAVYSKRSLKLSSLSNSYSSSYHIWALQLRHLYDGGPRLWETAFEVNGARLGIFLAARVQGCSETNSILSNWRNVLVFLEVEAIAFRFLPALVLFHSGGLPAILP
ncbi:hypothetical protein Tco_0884276 [Tanacetum coccineum]